MADLRAISNPDNVAGGITAEELAAHEALEVYYNAAGTTSHKWAHNKTIDAGFRGRVFPGSNYQNEANADNLVSKQTGDYQISNTKASLRITSTLVTPIAKNSLSGLGVAFSGATPNNITSAKVVPR